MVKKILIFLGLLLVALAERLWFDLGPNIELIMVASVLASMYLGRKWGASLAVVALALSDLVLGNTMIMLFTWSAFFVIGFNGRWINKWKGGRRIVAGSGYGLVSALGFYFYTNFGVWLITPMYEKTFGGLIKCYVMALPFLRLHAVSSVFLVGGGVAILDLVRFITRKRTLLYQATNLS
ncbi:hypothetical protein KKB06_04165 [Patescibacteria group bacterium]|nr:hypothetical protein [Patescibacteria group bacterium]